MYLGIHDSRVTRRTVRVYLDTEMEHDDTWTYFIISYRLSPSE